MQFKRNIGKTYAAAVLALVAMSAKAANDGFAAFADSTTNIKPTTEMAYRRYPSVNLDFLGASNIIGVSYEHPLGKTSPLAVRAGLAYGIIDMSSGWDGGGDWFDYYSVPIEINYLTGKRRNHFELAFGVDLGMFIAETETYEMKYEEGGGVSITDTGTTRDTYFGYFFFGNIGYRHEGRRHWQFRCGITPSFHFNDLHGVDKALLYPYFSVGYRF